MIKNTLIKNLKKKDLKFSHSKGCDESNVIVFNYFNRRKFHPTVQDQFDELAKYEFFSLKNIRQSQKHAKNCVKMNEKKDDIFFEKGKRQQTLLIPSYFGWVEHANVCTVLPQLFRFRYIFLHIHNSFFLFSFLFGCEIWRT